MANIDLLGPASAPGAVTARPNETRVFGQAETWFAPCTSQSSRDGTQLQAVFQNGLLAQVRYALKASGITLDNADDAMLWKAILAAVAAGAPPGTSLWHTADDTSNAAGTIVASVTPSIAAHGRYWYGIKVNQACSGATQAVINGLPSRAVVRTDGSPLQAGDYASNQEIILADDGAKLQFIAPAPSQIFQQILPQILPYTPAGARTANAFTANQTIADLPGNFAATIGQTAYVTGATYLDASAFVGFRTSSTAGIDCSGLIRVTGDGTTRTGDYLGARPAYGVQNTVSLRSVFQGLSRTVTYRIDLILTRGGTNDMLSIWDPHVIVLHNGNP